MDIASNDLVVEAAEAPQAVVRLEEPVMESLYLWPGSPPLLVRNYDYSPQVFEAVILDQRHHHNGKCARCTRYHSGPSAKE